VRACEREREHVQTIVKTFSFLPTKLILEYAYPQKKN